MSSSINNSIKISDYRNLRYQGTLDEDGQFDGIGILLDDQFAFILAEWKNGVMHGPCFIMFPDQQIFYGRFQNGQADGVCCFDTTDACQIFCLFNNGKLQGNISSIFDSIDYIVKSSVSAKGAFNVIEQINYGQQQQMTRQGYIQRLQKEKWKLTQEILKARISDEQKEMKKFIVKQFIERFSKILQFYQVPKKKQMFFGLRGEGFGIKFDEGKAKSVGHFNDAKILSLMGKKIINKSKQVRQEGLFNKPETLIRYQYLSQRPNSVRKVYRKFYKQSLQFYNQFYNMQKIKELQNIFQKIKVNIKENTIQKIAQQLLENPVPIQLSLTYNSIKNHEPQKSRQYSKTPPKQTSKISQFSNEEVSLQRLKEELNKTMQKKNYSFFDNKSNSRLDSKSKSPYKVYDQPPAELKYTSKGANKDDSLIKSKEQSYFNSRKPIQNSSFLIDTSMKSLTPKKAGAIVQNKKKKSPTKYEKYSSPINRNLRDESPKRIYANIELSEEIPSHSKSPYRKLVPKINETSDMYDNLQSRKQRLEAYNRLQQNNSRQNYRNYQQEDHYNSSKSPKPRHQRYKYDDHEFKDNPNVYGVNYTASRKTEIPEKYPSPYSRDRNIINPERTSSYHHYKNYRNN